MVGSYPLQCRESGITIARSKFANPAGGHSKLHEWLIANAGQDLPVHACMEATGSYGQALADFLHDKVAKLSDVNPRVINAHIAWIKSRSQSLIRNSMKPSPRTWKTDAITSSCSTYGIGAKNAACLMAELQYISGMQCARQLAAYADTTPRIFRTGTGGKSRTPMGKA